MSKTRLSVPLSETLYNAIKVKSDSMGISMSSYVSFVVSQTVQTETQVINELTKLVGSILEKNPPIKEIPSIIEANKTDDK